MRLRDQGNYVFQNESRNPRLDAYKATGSSDLLGVSIRARIAKAPLPFSFHQSSTVKQKQIVSITSHPDQSRNARCFHGPRMRINLVVVLLLGITSCDFRDTSAVGLDKSDSLDRLSEIRYRQPRICPPRLPRKLEISTKERSGRLESSSCFQIAKKMTIEPNRSVFNPEKPFFNHYLFQLSGFLITP